MVSNPLYGVLTGTRWELLLLGVCDNGVEGYSYTDPIRRERRDGEGVYKQANVKGWEFIDPGKSRKIYWATRDASINFIQCDFGCAAVSVF